MMKHLIQQKNLLKVLKTANPKLRRAILESADSNFIKGLVESVDNLLRGNIPITPSQKTQLQKKKKIFYKIQSQCCRKNKIIHTNKAAKLLNQSGGALPLLISALLPIITKAVIGGSIAATSGYVTKKIIGE